MTKGGRYFPFLFTIIVHFIDSNRLKFFVVEDHLEDAGETRAVLLTALRKVNEELIRIWKESFQMVDLEKI